MGSCSKLARGAGSDGTLAPGFRFHPTDEELVRYYLKRKVCGKPFRYDPISEIDIYRLEPWDLPSLSRLKTRDLQWYFFSVLDKKYGNSCRTNRATTMGYWKTTGKDRPVYHKSRTVGMKKTLVYHFGRAPRGQRTNWVMHEYRLEDDELIKMGILQDAFVLCRIHQKSGAGPKNGEQYGAPFIEEEWDDDDDDAILVPKEETGAIEDPLFLAGVEGQVQPDGYEQHPDMAIRNDNVFPGVHLEENDSFNNEPEPVWFNEEQHEEFLDGMDPSTHLQELQQGSQFLEGMNENTYLEELHPCPANLYCHGETLNTPDLPDNQAFGNMEENYYSESHQVPVKEDYVEVNDADNPVQADCFAVGRVEEGCMHSGSFNDQPKSEDGCFLELDDLLNPGEANHESGFEELDDLLMYFDATDDQLPFFGSESIVAPEMGVVASQKTVEGASSSKQKLELQSNTMEGASSSKQKLELQSNTMEGASSSKQKLDEKSINDFHYERGWDKFLAKRFTGMLGSIAAPPAFAAQYGVEERTNSVGQSSNDSGSIQVTAGMLHISDRLTITGGEKHWSLQKVSNGNVGFLVSYDISEADMITAAEPSAEISGKAMSMLWRAGFYLCFIWVPIIAVSFKIGCFIYSK